MDCFMQSQGEVVYEIIIRFHIKCVRKQKFIEKHLKAKLDNMSKNCTTFVG